MSTLIFARPWEGANRTPKTDIAAAVTFWNTFPVNQFDSGGSFFINALTAGEKPTKGNQGASRKRSGYEIGPDEVTISISPYRVGCWTPRITGIRSGRTGGREAGYSGNHDHQTGWPLLGILPALGSSKSKKNRAGDLSQVQKRARQRSARAELNLTTLLSRLKTYPKSGEPKAILRDKK